MKKILSIVLALMLVSVAAVAEGEITVLTREDGSGTLSAFTELFGIEEMVPEAIITNSTAVMMGACRETHSVTGKSSCASARMRSVSPQVESETPRRDMPYSRSRRRNLTVFS